MLDSSKFLLRVWRNCAVNQTHQDNVWIKRSKSCTNLQKSTIWYLSFFTVFDRNWPAVILSPGYSNTSHWTIFVLYATFLSFFSQYYNEGLTCEMSVLFKHTVCQITGHISTKICFNQITYKNSLWRCSEMCVSQILWEAEYKLPQHLQCLNVGTKYCHVPFCQV